MRPGLGDLTTWKASAGEVGPRWPGRPSWEGLTQSMGHVFGQASKGTLVGATRGLPGELGVLKGEADALILCTLWWPFIPNSCTSQNRMHGWLGS